MSANAAYVVFDGDKDGWAYRYMRGWKENNRIDFDFKDAHDIDEMTGRAQNEDYVKRHLRQRMRESSVIIVLVGESTRHLYKYIRWELELALELKLPIIIVNLSNAHGKDVERCPPIVRDVCDVCAAHVPYKLAAIKHAIANWPGEFYRLSTDEKGKGSRHYSIDLYNAWVKDKD